ncbi:transcriptional regulator [Secundilactobacillus odoratitofui DSM 19909 = JCM 15043]|uniref:Segregation and condensation protein B n=1 Tax=Secundilactobacillus odoratitofui DSM 19909 = JCM 15043 TaxID=1423776 RepID=A0A0R1LRM7_9LACO|nr:SMC-Scp complex subunit ScpB [Secundilactobacillus odoratitofui]KRK98120.1 transcriptional regulator [Secundilactobacillus odoratitofui DSM 19909 = JCM 15043]
MSKMQQLEALLFVSGETGLTIKELASLTGSLVPAVNQTLAKLNEKYQSDPDCALVILKSSETVRLATKETLAQLVSQYFEAPSSTGLSQASLEVLAIIAYNQPITRIEIDEIRGVQSSATLNKLLLRQLITEAGRRKGPGRPKLYQTTDYFTDYFGLDNIDQLPPLPEAKTTADDQANGDLFLKRFNEQFNVEDN